MAADGKVLSPNADGVSLKEIKLALTEKAAQQIKELVLYKNKDLIAMYGVISVQKELNKLASEFVCEIIQSRHDALKTQIDDRKLKRNTTLFRELVARGVPTAQAYEQAYGEKPLA
jgi:hypothetical protein